MNLSVSITYQIHFPEIKDTELTGFQNVHFGIDTRGPDMKLKLPNLFQIDNRSMGPMDSPRYLNLNGVEEWKLTTNLGTHPFHIHVNPFYVSKIVHLPTFDSKSKTWIPPQPTEEIPDITWRDTFIVSAGQEVYFRTRYKRYIGQFVLHCHILDHEDEGMMQMVEVVINPMEHGGHGSSHAHM